MWRTIKPSNLMHSAYAWKNANPLRTISNRMFSVDSLLIKLEEFRPIPDIAQSHLIEKLANCRLESIGTGVKVIRFDDTKGVGLRSLSPDLLFVRPFYADLLAAIRKCDSTVLIGNPGIGKSFFQYYYLARIMNPALFGPLPPDCYGSTAPPEIVIRQEGIGIMTVFDIANRKAVTVDGCPIQLLRSFDPETSLYLMEPGKSVMEPHIEGIKIPTLTTVSPLLARYKEFVKNGGIMRYMPFFELQELLDIGKYLLDNGYVPEEMREEYSPENITKRFHTFGGIFRHVLPLSVEYLRKCLKERRKAIFNCDAHALLQSGDIEDTNVSHFVMKYVVIMGGKFPFEDFRLDFVNHDVASEVEVKLNESSLNDRRLALIRNDETGFMAQACPMIYESVVADHLTSRAGVQWNKREVAACGDKKGVVEWTPFSLALDEQMLGAPPEYAHMKTQVLYVPTKSNFAFCDLMFKTTEGQLVMIQVSRIASAKREIGCSKLLKFLLSIKFPDHKASLLQYVLIPLPSKADIANVQVEKEKKKKKEAKGGKLSGDLEKANNDIILQLRNSAQVWKLPNNYASK